MVLLLMRNRKVLYPICLQNAKKDHFWKNNYKEKQKGVEVCKGYIVQYFRMRT